MTTKMNIKFDQLEMCYISQLLWRTSSHNLGCLSHKRLLQFLPTSSVSRKRPCSVELFSAIWVAKTPQSQQQVSELMEAWDSAQKNVQNAQKAQKRAYYRRSKETGFEVVCVHAEGEVNQGL